MGGAGRFSATTEGDTELIDVLQAALTSLGDADSSLRARLLIALAEVLDARDWELRRDLVTEAVALARGVGDDATLVDVMTKSYPFLIQPESSAERLVETQEAAVLADRLGDPVVRFRARYNRMHACLESGDLGEADRQLSEMQTLVHQTGIPVYEWDWEIHRSCRLCLSGDLAAAEASNDTALEIGARIDAPQAMAAYGSVLFVMRNQQGRLDEIADLFTQAAADNPALSVLRAAVVAMNCALGRLDEARVLFELDAANGFVDFSRDQVWTTAMVLCADSAVDLVDKQAARVLYDEMHPFLELVAFNHGTVEGALSRPLGRLAHLLGHHDDAESLFQAALSINERIEAPYWIARTKLDYADLLVDRAQSDEVVKAKEIVRQALAAAHEHGFGALERRANALLESIR